MPDQPSRNPQEIVRSLLRVRQYREFRPEPVAAAALDAIVDAGRWSGSAQNSQPCRFIVLRDEATLRRLAKIGVPQTRGLRTAPCAIAVALPEDDPHLTLIRAFDEGRAVERMLVAATELGLGAGISWIRGDVLPGMRDLVGLPDGWIVRSVVAVGYPTDEARKPKSAPGQGRLPRSETVFDERWQAR